MQEYASKIQELKKKYPDDETSAMVEGWEKSLKRSTLFLDLQNHAAFKIIFDGYVAELRKIDKAIADPVLFRDEAGRVLGIQLHERRQFILAFLRPFRDATITVGYISNELEKSLKEE